MNQTFRVTMLLLALFTLTACGSLPEVTSRYHLSATRVHVTVLRTIGCDKNNYPVISASVTPLVQHFADTSEQTLDLAKLQGTLSDTDIKIEFFDDGRLKGINATNEGKAEDILKTAISLLARAHGLDDSAKPFPNECKFLASIDDGKPVTLTYETDVDVNALHTRQAVPPDLTSLHYVNQLKSAIGEVCVYVDKSHAGTAPITTTGAHRGASMKVRQPGSASLRVTAGLSDGKDQGCGPKLWTGEVTVAQLGTIYELPVPAPKPFGKQIFAATFAESGALTSVQYAGTPGAGQVLGVLDAASSATKGRTAAEKAAELNSQADLIAAQQRLVRCVATPDKCE